ncbi:hypothetical protein PR003_g829 [Phytophthora rubi]|uniref:Chromo domain-containing protein n=1 Tax=Phytophthora rubi TaxID=129364 RepID=A0A6A3NRP1_9STRA|nr:hypothetical protein PR002_g674 [Phytophthora rubi]KAE9052282.1 hypothetical protein PR001_g656 [Phytophthora rubi]KAE9359266.1 hypothetical protein PR003_g829 [Phytophthora rubi]
MRRHIPYKHYRVRWLGHSSVEDTWKPRSRFLENILDVMSDYKASLACATATPPHVTRTPRATSRANPLARITMPTATTCRYFQILVYRPNQRRSSSFSGQRINWRSHSLSVGLGRSWHLSLHVAQATLALRHLAHARTNLPNGVCAARGFAGFEPRREEHPAAFQRRMKAHHASCSLLCEPAWIVFFRRIYRWCVKESFMTLMC